MKMLGMLMVMSGCIGAGLWYSFIYNRKWRNLKDCQKAVLILRNEIVYGRTPLPEAFAQMADRTNGSVARFFDTVAQRLEEGGGRLEEIWGTALQEILTSQEMGKEDQKELEGLGNTLGYLDTQLQVQALELYEKRLEGSLQNWEREKEKKTRLYPVLGTMGGALICLIIM
ncbi:MAG: stage III sporulation protein AB [Eubacterium sp.]|nr:stage III sporulation protein AB [Eubacterium sp.]